jgi:hypothetical protein
MQAQGKSSEAIQHALAALRAGQTGVVNKVPPLDTATANSNIPQPSPYSGGLLPSSNAPDQEAMDLAKKLGGQAQVYFRDDPEQREFDAISDQYIGQTKATGITDPGQKIRNQLKATFDAAKATGRTPYFEFTAKEPSPNMLQTISRYESRYGIDAVISTPSNPGPVNPLPRRDNH